VLFFIQGFRWWILLRAFIPGIPLSRTLMVHCKSIYYSILLPTSAPQDLIRAGMLTNKTNYDVIWGSTWVAKLIATAVLPLLFTVGYFLRQNLDVSPVIYKGASIALVVLVVALIMSFSKIITRPLRPVVGKLLPAKFLKIIESVRQSVYMYRGKYSRIFSVFLLSVLMQFVSLCNVSLIIKGITGSFHFLDCLFFVPLIEMAVISVPVTPCGAGIREVFMTLFLTNRLGFCSEQTAMYISFGVMVYVLRVFGGFFVLFDFINNRRKVF
jgi:hypothetical protein